MVVSYISGWCDKVIEPIAFMGRKFTESALKWYTYKKECYAEYASMKAYEDYIYGRWLYVYKLLHQQYQSSSG